MNNVTSQATPELFGLEDYHLVSWAYDLRITPADVEFAKNNFTKEQRRFIALNFLKPTQLLADKPELLCNINVIDEQFVISLSDKDFFEHLSSLVRADKIKNSKSQTLKYPYDIFDAESFSALRESRNPADVSLIRNLYKLSYTDPSYAKQRIKLNALSALPKAINQSLTFSVTSNVGKAKYVVNYHDGIAVHTDSSPFFNVKILKSKPELNQFVNELIELGYTEK